MCHPTANMDLCYHSSSSLGNHKRSRRHRSRRTRDKKAIVPRQESVVPVHGSCQASARPVHVPKEPSLQDFVALDCEMVGVGPQGRRSVLARVSVISGDGCCLLDTFVRVEEKVTDYRR